MKTCFLLTLTFLSFSSLPSFAQNNTGEIVFVKNSMSNVVSKNTPIQKIADGFSFIEGPVWNNEGFLLFSDIPNNKILKYIPGEGVTVFLENSGYVGSDVEAEGRGSNGLTYDENSNLIICQHGARQVVKYDRAGNFTPVARQYGGKRLNSPNDAVVSSKGVIYFTDPPWGLSLNMEDPAKELSIQGVYKINKGNMELIDGELNMPNGIAFSPDEKHLYVADSDKGKKLYYRYAIDENGEVGKKILFFDASALEGDGGPDGIKVDKKGNCYFTGPGGVLVVSAKGELLGIIAPPEQPANIGWGGKDGKTLFMTCRTGLYAVDLKIEGIPAMP